MSERRHKSNSSKRRRESISKSARHSTDKTERSKKPRLVPYGEDDADNLSRSMTPLDLRPASERVRTEHKILTHLDSSPPPDFDYTAPCCWIGVTSERATFASLIVEHSFTINMLDAHARAALRASLQFDESRELENKLPTVEPSVRTCATSIPPKSTTFQAKHQGECFFESVLYAMGTMRSATKVTALRAMCARQLRTNIRFTRNRLEATPLAQILSTVSKPRTPVSATMVQAAAVALRTDIFIYDPRAHHWLHFAGGAGEGQPAFYFALVDDHVRTIYKWLERATIVPMPAAAVSAPVDAAPPSGSNVELISPRQSKSLQRSTARAGLASNRPNDRSPSYHSSPSEGGRSDEDDDQHEPINRSNRSAASDGENRSRANRVGGDGDGDGDGDSDGDGDGDSNADGAGNGDGAGQINSDGLADFSDEDEEIAAAQSKSLRFPPLVRIFTEQHDGTARFSTEIQARCERYIGATSLASTFPLDKLRLDLAELASSLPHPLAKPFADLGETLCRSVGALVVRLNMQIRSQENTVTELNRQLKLLRRELDNLAPIPMMTTKCVSRQMFVQVPGQRRVDLVNVLGRMESLDGQPFQTRIVNIARFLIKEMVETTQARFYTWSPKHVKVHFVRIPFEIQGCVLQILYECARVNTDNMLHAGRVSSIKQKTNRTLFGYFNQARNVYAKRNHPTAKQTTADLTKFKLSLAEWQRKLDERQSARN